MINLLPYESKKELKACRGNSLLVRCLLTLAAAILFLAGAYFLTLNLLNRAIEINKDLSKNTSLSTDTITTNEQAETAKTNLNLADQILSQQIIYSKLLAIVSEAIPSGVVLDNIAVNNSTINAPLTLSLHAVSTDKVKAIADSFQSSAIFSSYDFVSANQDSTNPNYPTAVTVKVTIRKENLREN